MALGVAAFPARLGAWALLFGAGFVATLVGRGSRWHNSPGAVLVCAACAVLGAIFSLSLAFGEAYWFGAWSYPLLVLAGLSMAWTGPAVAEAMASWEFLRGRRRRGAEWRDLFRDEHENVA